MKNRFQTLLPHLVAVILFIFLAIIYCKPILNNKTLSQHDVVQFQGSAQEIIEHEKKTGEHTLWTNSMFGGMPSYTIVGNTDMSLTSNFAGFITYILPQPVNVIFFLLLGFYIMMAVLGFNPFLSILGSIAFTFSSYNFISLEAGHISKVLAVAYAPPLIAGCILLYRGKYIAGTIVTAVFMFLELYANHVQITYYLGIALLLYAVFEFIMALREKRIRQFITASCILLLLSAVALGSMASKFWTTYEYSQYTIRGPSELKNNTQSQGGLDKDYAYSWSYGVGETFTFLVPDFYGGTSQGSLDKESETYKTVKKYYGAQAANGFVENQLPLYWGDQPSTGGPAYLGAIVCFLFVLSMFVVRNPLKWWALGIVLLFTMMSWGKNFDALTDFLFNNVPLYNKFRAVTMIHAIVSMLMSFMAIWGVKEILEKKADTGKAFNSVKYIALTFIGFLLLLYVLGGSLFSFQKEKTGEELTSDEYFVSSLEKMTQDKNAAEDIFEALVEDRSTLLREDALRSLIFILLAAAALWFYFKNKLNSRIVSAALILLVLADMWPVCKRYLNNDDFLSKRKQENQFSPSEADQRILADEDPNFRVINRGVSTFNDATTSYYHKSIGGYSAAKMRRYQDLIEKHISEGNMNVLNMLNTKYIIQPAGDKLISMKNPMALGHAWFVEEVKWVNDADEEINALKDFEPGKIAIIDKRFKDKVGNLDLKPDSAASIKLVQYQPDYLTYQTNSGSAQLAVFSEIYYNNSLGWESYIDGKHVPHFRVNYILRGMIIPPGSHKVEFKFEPRSYYTGEKIALICSLLLFGGIIGLVVYQVKTGKEEETDIDEL